MEKVWEVRWTTMAADEFESTIDWLIENWNFEIEENLVLMFGKEFKD